MPPVLDTKTIEFLEDTCIFCQPWWLQAVAPDSWDVAVVERGGEVAAVLPYAYKVRLGRFKLIEMPPLTPYLGPWLRNSTAKYVNRLSEEKELMTELTEKLPTFAVFQQGFHPSITNWLPFYWRGYKQTTRYTYITDCNKNLDAAWDETRENIRTDIRKAQKTVEVVDTPDIDRFLRVLKTTFQRQGKPLPYTEEVVRRVESACEKQNVRKMLFAQDAEGQTHAAVYLVWDAKSVYYLLGGGDPALRNSGATSLLIWKAIEFALSHGKRFDFEGSVVESIERFFRAFGARQVPYFEVSKMNSRIVRAYRALWRWTHRGN
jgi:lipid II:glycine glycyltransferase (peptidoglycan interpeptide bridge formation enzyme)